MRTLITLLVCFVVTFITAQNQDPRIELTKPVEAKIEAYINNSLKTYKVSKGELSQLNKNDDDHHKEFKKLTKVQKEEIILSGKKAQLRGQFFKENPKYRELYVAKPSAKNLLQDGCVNEGFENGTTGYNFYSAVNWGYRLNVRNGHPGGHNVNLGAQVGDNTPKSNGDPFNPVDLTTTNSHVELVTPGNDETLFAIDASVQLPRVLNGNSAIRLNSDNDGPEEATVLVKKFTSINERYMSFNFALFFNNPEHVDSINEYDPFVRFEIYDNTINKLIKHRVITSNDAGKILTPIDGSGYKYIPWNCTSFDLDGFIGHDVTFRAIISDCNLTEHSGVLYLDDICNNGNICDATIIGDINLNPQEINCPKKPFDICGTFVLPSGAVGAPNLTLEIPNLIPGVILNPTITNGTFCFTVDPSNFVSNPSGSYSANVEGVFTMDDGSLVVINDDTGVNITFNNCGDCDIKQLNPRFEIINGLGHIVWNDLDSSYTIQIVSDADCFTINNDTRPVVFKEYTINGPASSFNIHQAFADMDRNEVRWKFKSNCSEWSDWCCAILYGNDPNNLLLESDCYETIDCPNGPITLTSPTHDINSGVTNYIDYTIIGASNKISTTGKSEYRAGNSVTLTPGFEVVPGGDYWGHILECIDYGNPTGSLDTPKNLISNVFTVFPNPAEYSLTMEVDQDEINSLYMYNTQGQVIYSNTTMSAKNFNLNVEDFARGFYILKAVLSNQSVIYKNVILK